MSKALSRLAVTLKWLAGLWIVGWTLYLTLLDDARLLTVEGLLNALATLLVPAAFAFGLSLVLDRLQQTSQRIQRT
jgi:hypothetical protein